MTTPVLVSGERPAAGEADLVLPFYHHHPPLDQCYVHNMAEKKAVLNVTVSGSIAAAVRRMAAREHSTISSVVERALARNLYWELKRREGLAAIDEYYREHGQPDPQEVAAAEAWVDELEREFAEVRRADRGRRGRPA
jgi:hypothetical protein